VTLHVPALVVGAGISGLVCTHVLRKRGIDAQLLEALPRPGGVIRSERRDGFLLELGPQSFSGTESMLELSSELTIENQVVQAPPGAPRYVAVGGRLRRVPFSPRTLFASSLLSGHTKWTILRDIFGRTVPPTSDESIAAFVRRKFSPELLDRLVSPFVSGIYAGDPEKLSLRATFPNVYDAERLTGSVIRGMIGAGKTKTGVQTRKTSSLLSFQQGNETLVKALAAILGNSLRCGVAIETIQQKGGRSDPFELTLIANEREETIVADNLVLATPTMSGAKLLRGLWGEFETVLGAVDYAPVAVISLGYQKADVGHPLNGFGFLVPRSSNLRVLGTVWNSSLFPNRAPDGYALLTSFIGGVTDPQAVKIACRELAANVHREIAPLLAIRQLPAFSNVTLYDRAIPQYDLRHLERLAVLQQLRLRFSNLWLTGNYLHGPAIGACVEHARAVAHEVSNSLQ